MNNFANLDFILHIYMKILSSKRGLPLCLESHIQTLQRSSVTDHSSLAKCMNAINM